MDFKTLIEQITNIFGNFTKKQKIITAAATLSVIGFIIFLILYSNASQKEENSYKTLFDQLSASDAALAIKQLESDNIPYKLLEGGTIKVPREFVYKERITIAAQGIPKDSQVGFELFDKQNFGETDFAQQIKYLRALEGELARTIENLNQIDSAKIHIALPKESLFVEKNVLPTASLVLNINPNMKLSSNQITGIKNLVASSVSKLTTENVTIVNQNGEPLGGNEEDFFQPDLVAAQIKYKRDYEKNYEEKVENILAPILGGSDRIVAKVTIDFNFEQKEITDEYYDPESVARSEQSSEEKKEGTNGEKEASGVPGAISNITPADKPLDKGDKKEKYEKSTTTTNYEISKKITNTKGEFATINRLTVAVVVDGKYELNDAGELEYIALENTEIDAIRNIIKRTVGFDKKRGDEVSLSNLKFKSRFEDQPVDIIDKTSSIINKFLPIIKYLIALIILFIFYKKIITPFTQKMLQDINDQEEEDDLDGVNSIETEADADALSEYQKARERIENEMGIGEGFDEDYLKYEVLLQKFKDETEENVEEVAKLLETILRPEKES
jgi:flagellar M-ring protein FliF